MVASALAGRAFWGAGLGGVPGLLSGAAGLALVFAGLSGMDIDSRGLTPGLFSGAPGANLALAGVALVAAAGPLALAGALGGELAATSLLDDDGDGPPATSRRAPPGEVPLAYAEGLPGVAY